MSRRGQGVGRAGEAFPQLGEFLQHLRVVIRVRFGRSGCRPGGPAFPQRGSRIQGGRSTRVLQRRCHEFRKSWVNKLRGGDATQLFVAR